MITYFRMKIMQWKVKVMLYGTILGILENQEDVIELIKKMYVSLKDTSADNFREEFITKLAEVIHEQNEENETE